MEKCNIKKLKEALLIDSIFSKDTLEIEIPAKLNKRNGKWIVKRRMEAKYEQKDGRSIEVKYDYRAKRFEMWVASGYGRNEIFYEDEIPLIKEAGKLIKELRKDHTKYEVVEPIKEKQK